MFNLNSRELLSRLIFLLAALVVYRLGSHIPVPGVNTEALLQLYSGKSGILELFNLFSGGALSRFSVFALGIMPYISASIVVQLLSVVLPSLEALKKEGDSGRRKLSQYTRYLTLCLALVEAFFIVSGMESKPGVVVNPGLSFEFTAVVSLVTGTIFLMWLGEQITERGLGNGISILIFAGIASGIPSALTGLLELVAAGSMKSITAIIICIVAVFVTFFVVFVERGFRKITVNYAKRQVGNKIMGGQSTHLPLKLNTAGVIPPIFASSIILLPATIVGWFSVGGDASKSNGLVASVIADLAAMLTPGQPMYLLLYAFAIFFFCFFYTALMFNSRDVADNLKKSGAFIPGIRPGENTSKFVDKILSRLTMCGSVYICLVCMLPEFLIATWKVPFFLGGTSLLIVVVVTMDFMAQVQAQLMSSKYDSLLKKSNFKR